MLVDMHSAILTHLRDQWAAINATMPIHMPNDPPIETPLVANIDFLRATFLPVGSEQAEIGEPGSARHDSILVVDIFTDLGEGSGVSMGYADNIIETVFKRGTRLTKNGLTAIFAEAEPLAGRDDGNGHWQVPVHCPWHCYYQN